MKNMKNTLVKLLSLLMAMALLVPGLSVAEELDATPDLFPDAVETVEAAEPADPEIGIEAVDEAVTEIDEALDDDAEAVEAPEIAESFEAAEAVEAPEAVAVVEESAAAKLMEGEAAAQTAVVTNKAVLTLNVGETRQLAVDGKTIKTCKSSKKKVAGVTKTGLVTAKKAGKSKLTVKLAGKKGKKLAVTVKVVDPYAPSSVSIANGKSVTLTKGQTVQLTAALAPATAQSTLTWKSSKKKIASVDANGLVTAKKKGKTTITVKTRNGKKAKIKVTVTKAAAQPGNRIDLSAYLGQNLGQTAKKFGLKWNSSDITGYYSSKQLEMSWELEKYWDEAEVQCITIKKDPKGKYSLYGLYLGMSDVDAIGALAALGFKANGTLGSAYEYSTGKGSLYVTFGSNRKVKKLSVDTSWT